MSLPLLLYPDTLVHGPSDGVNIQATSGWLYLIACSHYPSIDANLNAVTFLSQTPISPHGFQQPCLLFTKLYNSLLGHDFFNCPYFSLFPTHTHTQFCLCQCPSLSIFTKTPQHSPPCPKLFVTGPWFGQQVQAHAHIHTQRDRFYVLCFSPSALSIQGQTKAIVSFSVNSFTASPLTFCHCPPHTTQAQLFSLPPQASAHRLHTVLSFLLGLPASKVPVH